MAKGKGKSRRAKLIYPKHLLNPSDFLHFMEVEPFHCVWEDFGFPDEELEYLQALIMLDPTAAPVIEGTGGVRKLRFVPFSWNVGKSGGLRVLYVYFEQYFEVYLLVVYSKSKADDLTNSQKNAIRKLVERLEEGLKRSRELVDE